MCDLDTFALAKDLVAEMEEMLDDQKELDINDNFYDYLSGSISARGVIVGKLGFGYLTNDLAWTDC